MSVHINTSDIHGIMSKNAFMNIHGVKSLGRESIFYWSIELDEKLSEQYSTKN